MSDTKPNGKCHTHESARWCQKGAEEVFSIETGKDYGHAAELEPTSAGGITMPRATIVGREVEIAQQKAEEAVMWAVKAATA